MFDIELLKKLCAISSVSGYEEGIQSFIVDEISPYADSIKRDTLGNIIAFKKGKSKRKDKLLVLCSVDEKGMLINGINEKGFLSFTQIGKYPVDDMLCRKVRVGDKSICGVIGTTPVHMLKKEEKSKAITADMLAIDIGASSKEDAEKYVSVGDIAYFEDEFTACSYRFLSKGLSDKIACACMINAIKMPDVSYDTYFAFTVQGLISARGAKVASYSVNPDKAIIVGSSLAKDIPTFANQEPILNGGVVIPYISKNLFCNRGMLDTVCKYADELKVKYQSISDKDENVMLKAVSQSREGIDCVALNVACRYKDNITMMADKDDCIRLSILLEYVINNEI